MTKHQITTAQSGLEQISCALAAYKKSTGIEPVTSFEGDLFYCSCGEIDRQVDLRAPTAPFHLKTLLNDIYAITPISAVI